MVKLHLGYCIWKWEPMDSPKADNLAVCDYLDTGFAHIIIGLGVIWNVGAHIIVGLVFTYKLNKVLKMTDDGSDKRSSFKLKSLRGLAFASNKCL